MRDTAPVFLRCHVGKTDELLFGENIPKAELNTCAPIVALCHGTGHKSLCADSAPFTKARTVRFYGIGGLNKRARINRFK